MNQQKSSKNIIQVKRRTAQAFLGLLLIGITLNSCNNSGKAKLSKEDSVKLYEAMIEENQAVYEMKLPVAALERLFLVGSATPNTVKQLKFRWIKSGNEPWAMEAYGVDDKGGVLSGPVALDIPDKAKGFRRNWRKYVFVDDFYTRRGHLKYIYKSDNAGKDEPIKVFRDLYIDPQFEMYYPDPDSDEQRMYFIIKAEGDKKSKKLLGALQTYANPAPPFGISCTNCDANEY